MENTKQDRKSKGGLRSAARLYAVQMIYRATILGCETGDIIDKHCDRKEIFITENTSISEMDYDFFLLLIKNTKNNLSRIDEIISQNLSDDWKLERIDNVVKSILRLGTAELLYFEDVPPNVTFNEYVEISKSFFEKNEVSFVNGVLNSINKDRAYKNAENKQLTTC